MSTALMIEIFGYIGCIFVIISMLMTSVVKLRVINIYNLIKLSKADGNHYDMIRGNKEDSYLTYFIKHYKEDMKKYFLENTLELSAADTIYTVCCEGFQPEYQRERKRRLCKERIVQIGARKFLSSSVNEYKKHQPIPFKIHTVQ